MESYRVADILEHVVSVVQGIIPFWCEGGRISAWCGGKFFPRPV